MPSDELEQLFPNLAGSGYSIESEQNETYNCVAWAAGVTDDWWWPEENAHWPVEPRAPTLDSFVRAFETLGYEPCDTSEVEPGYEEVAIYVSRAGLATHAARQLATGDWTSKLGDMEDITHRLDALEGPAPAFGRVEQILRRPRPVPETPLQIRLEGARGA
jgi:hypothetical protein